jgi:hypothetical protein
MKRFALILCLLGFAFLIVGSAMAAGHSLPGTTTITSYGTIVSRSEEPKNKQQSEQTGHKTPLDQIGYVTALLGAGFFSSGLLINRKRN